MAPTPATERRGQLEVNLVKATTLARMQPVLLILCLVMVIMLALMPVEPFKPDRATQPMPAWTPLGTLVPSRAMLTIRVLTRVL